MEKMEEASLYSERERRQDVGIADELKTCYAYILPSFISACCRYTRTVMVNLFAAECRNWSVCQSARTWKRVAGLCACARRPAAIPGSIVHMRCDQRVFTPWNLKESSCPACMGAMEPRSAVAHREDSACHFWHTCHRFAITALGCYSFLQNPSFFYTFNYATYNSLFSDCSS